MSYVKLKCTECDNCDCKLCEIGKWLDYNSEEGCIRECDELLADKYYHLRQEVMPFLSTYNNKNTVKEIFNEIDDIENQLYNNNINNKIDKKGKISI